MHTLEISFIQFMINTLIGTMGTKIINSLIKIKIIDQWLDDIITWSAWLNCCFRLEFLVLY